MKIRQIVLIGAATLALAAGPAHAGPGGIAGFGGVFSGCTGGQLGITGQNPGGVEWVFEVAVWCPTSLSQVVVATGNWNPSNGGPVQGLSFGSLSIGRVSCGGTGGVTVQVQMPGASLVQASASITRLCS